MIFCFTATGNSLYAARALDKDVRSIPHVLKEKKPLAFRADTIGIVCPIYGHEMPDMVKRFIEEAEIDTEYLYLILTYGNRHASAVELAEHVFRSAGKELSYAATVRMVDNFLPAFDMEEQMAMDKHVEEQLARIRAEISRRSRKIEAVTDTDRAQHQEYLSLVHSAPATVWANFDFTDRCMGCGLCAKVCPAGCVKLVNHRAVRKEKGCQACMACVHVCPVQAILMKPTLGFTEKNPDVRYRNPNVSLGDLVRANG